MKASRTCAFAAAVAAVAVVFLSSGAVGAVESEPPGLQFDGDKAVEVTATKATDVIVVNTTTSALTLAPSASLAVKGKVVPLDVQVSVDVLAPGASAAVTIQAVPAAVTTASPGSLTIVGKPETGAIVSAWRPLSFAPAKATAATPATDSLAVDADASGDVPTLTVPVQDGSCADLLGSQDTTGVGYITSGSDIAKVTYSCDGKNLAINADSTQEPGTYSGKVEVGDSTISLKVTDHWPVSVALLAALFGIAVGACQQARTAVTRPVALAKDRARDVAKRAEVAQEKFRQEYEGPSANEYDLFPGAGLELVRLRDAFDEALPSGGWLWRRLRSFIQSGPDAEAFKAATARLETFDQVVDGWPDAAAALNALGKKLEAIDEIDEPIDPFPEGLVRHASSLARPEGNARSLSIEAASKIADEARRAAKVLGILPKLSVYEAELQTIAEQLAPPGLPVAGSGFDDPYDDDDDDGTATSSGDDAAGALPGDREVLASGRRSYRQLYALLLAAEEVEVGAEDKLLALSARVEAAIQQLTAVEGTQGQALCEGFEVDGLRWSVGLPGMGTGLRVITDGLVDAVGAVRRRLGTDMASVRAVDLLMFLLAAALALVTALAAQFVGKPWGGAFDVVAFFVWGVGAIAVGTPLLTALRSVGEVSSTAEPAAAAPKAAAPKDLAAKEG